MTTTAQREQVKLDLDPRLGEQSSAKVSVTNSPDEEAYVSNSVDFYASADEDDNAVYISINSHTYVSLGLFGEPYTTHIDLISHRFTKAEAEALLAVLTNELGKLA